jgi:hypothetical protein
VNVNRDAISKAIGFTAGLDAAAKGDGTRSDIGDDMRSSVTRCLCLQTRRVGGDLCDQVRRLRLAIPVERPITAYRRSDGGEGKWSADEMEVSG